MTTIDNLYDIQLRNLEDVRISDLLSNIEFLNAVLGVVWSS